MLCHTWIIVIPSLGRLRVAVWAESEEIARLYAVKVLREKAIRGDISPSTLSEAVLWVMLPTSPKMKVQVTPDRGIAYWEA